MILPPRSSVLSWGRTPRTQAHRLAPHFRDETAAALEAARAAGLSALAIGLGRSYGDSGLNADQAVVDMRGVDRLIALDPEAGVLRAEAGA
ncbi:MAG: FAD-binding protein, partial [Alphaproteobacteria bacterium]|nr:FAD-binding protein [Alphaproteobacteria bacterium]